MTKEHKLGAVAAVAFIATIFAANWTLEHYGIWKVASLMVPSGVIWVGLAFTLRDLVHEGLGRVAVAAAVVAGAVLSFAVAPDFAVASGVAFLFSELADYAAYEPLRQKTFIGAVLVSGVIGAIVDSVLFLQLAFHNLDFIWGQLLGKWAVLAVTICVLTIYRAWRASKREVQVV